MEKEITTNYNKKIINNYSCGSKFDNLAILSDKFKIPNAICILANYLNEILYQCICNKEEFDNLFRDLETTAGCYLLNTYPEISESISKFKISKDHKNILCESMNDFFVSSRKYAVRSSAVHEDSEEHSFAGVYMTTLNVAGIDEIISAIETAVIQYYSYSALVERIRANNYSPYLELNIIIQDMINPEISGVAFSKTAMSQNKVLIEWIEGLGEGIVSGENKANIFIEDDLADRYGNVLLSLVEITKKISNILGYEVDVEWAYDNDTIYILQARAITNIGTISTETESLFKTERLYFGNSFEYDGKLGNCKSVYENYTSKRSIFYMQAKRNEIHFGIGYVILFNLKGINEHKEELVNLFPESESVIIDIDENIRQHIINKNELINYINDMFKNMPKVKTATIIIRQFIKGNCGVISHMVNSNTVLIEYSKDGLLYMNRGLANTKELVICVGDNSFVKHANEFLNEHSIKDIVKYTCSMSSQTNKYAIEWVILNSYAYFVDYSQELGSECEIINKSEVGKIIVPGNVEGPIYYLNMETILTRLSISPGVSVNQTNDILKQNPDLINIIKEIKIMSKKPIVFANKPYAILSFLFDDVSGFVFKQCSLLCHLAILMREHKIPSVVCENYGLITDKYQDASIINGHVIGLKEKGEQND